MTVTDDAVCAQALKAHRGGTRGIAPISFNLDNLCGSVASFTHRPLYPSGANPRCALNMWLGGPHHRFSSFRQEKISCPCPDSNPNPKSTLHILKGDADVSACTKHQSHTRPARSYVWDACQGRRFKFCPTRAMFKVSYAGPLLRYARKRHCGHRAGNGLCTVVWL